MDGSHHIWFSGQEDKDCLMDRADDATGRTLGLMSEEETTAAAMKVLWAWKVSTRSSQWSLEAQQIFIGQRHKTWI